MYQKKFGTHLKFYLDHIEDKEIPKPGLCSCSERDLISKEILDEYFHPNEDERYQLLLESCSILYCGAGTPDGEFRNYIFTPLRQTIVLFMAAINDEL